MARSRSRDLDRLYIGIGSHAVCIDPSSGEEIWRTKLKTTSFTTITRRGSEIYCGAGGELWCLNADSGEIVWHNKLKGLGLGLISFEGTNTSAAVAMMAQQAAAAGAAS